MFNLRNTECQKQFKEVTDKTDLLSTSIREDENIEVSFERFLKNLNRIFYKTFKKIRICPSNRITEIDKLMERRRLLRSKKDSKSIEELKKVEDKLIELSAKTNRDIINNEVSKLKTDDGGVNMASLWKLKNKLCNKAKETISAKVDAAGHLVTSGEKLKKLYLHTYEERLEDRKIKSGLEPLQKAKENLFELRKNEVKNKILPPWTMKQLQKVLRSLKKGKARDPLNLVNEIFRPEVAGSDLQLALLKVVNMVRAQQQYPTKLKYADITSVYKGKGKKSEMDNQRGLFNLVTIRSIIDKLVYIDEYDTIDTNLTDCNVGARKKRNIRDNLFVVNGVINSVIAKDDKPVDIELFYIPKCFDSLWLKECLNDLYEAGLDNSNLNLIYEGNRECFLSVKTPSGQTKRITVNETVMQGSVCCTTTMDKIGQRAYKNGSPLYMYKGMVSVPPLGMVDDELTISECGPKSTLTNVFMNNFTESKKLEFGIKKCNKMHTGEETLVCEDIRVHEEVGETVTKDKYVGDVLAANGSNTENVKQRTDKGYGIVNEIISILGEIPLGPYRVSVGLKLREAMLLNGILFNSEIWYNLKDEEVDKLSAVDEYLLRKILGAPAKTPKEALFLETGCIPVYLILKSRRLMYLHHILRRPEKELIRKFYEAQKSKVSKGDWVNTVQEDLKALKISLNDVEISKLSKHKFKKLLRKKIQSEAFENLMKIKKTHSKMQETNYDKLEIQSYLKSDSELTNDEKKVLMQCRTRMVSVRMNYKNLYEDKRCQLCKVENEDQYHLFNCQNLLDKCEALANNIEVEYEDIYSCREKQLKAVRLLTKILETKDQLMTEIN